MPSQCVWKGCFSQAENRLFFWINASSPPTGFMQRGSLESCVKRLLKRNFSHENRQSHNLTAIYSGRNYSKVLLSKQNTCWYSVTYGDVKINPRLGTLAGSVFSNVGPEYIMNPRGLFRRLGIVRYPARFDATNIWNLIFSRTDRARIDVFPKGPTEFILRKIAQHGITTHRSNIQLCLPGSSTPLRSRLRTDNIPGKVEI